MKIILVGDFTYPIYAPAFESGFKELGHDVITIKYNKYQYGNSIIGVFLTKIQNRFHIGYKLHSYNKEIISLVKEFKPDFVFLYRCYSVWKSTIDKIRSLGNYVFTYNNDDPFCGIPSPQYFKYFLKNINQADFNFVYRRKNLYDYHNLRLNNTAVLLPYFIKANNYPIDIVKDIPVGFIGHFENDGRDSMIRALIKANIPVSVFGGSDWSFAPDYTAIKSVLFPQKNGYQYNLTINRMQIALVFFSKINSDTYTRRCFEITAAKTLMLCEYSEDMDKLFSGNECAVYFHSTADLVEKCKYLLSNPCEIHRIALNGYNRLMEIGGSEVDRCIEIINYYERNKSVNYV